MSASSGLLASVLYPYLSRRLTVLLYHRVIPSVGDHFFGYEPTVSADPRSFDQQMSFVIRHFNVISLDTLVEWHARRSPLPKRPLLITFDDGYRDTYEYAWPVLTKYQLPSLLFVPTDFIGHSVPFDWDVASYCFCNTSEREAHLPLIGFRSWGDDARKRQVMHEWIQVLLEQPDDVRTGSVKALSCALRVEITQDLTKHIFLEWRQVREMQASGMAIGSHSRTHPALDRIGLEQARKELAESRRRILEECGRPPVAFAYPGGVFSAEVAKLVKDEGFDFAFTTSPGPTRLASVRERPWSVRRIGISQKDGAYRLLAKIAGLAKIKRSVLARVGRSYKRASA